MKHWPLAAILFTATLPADLPPAKIAERLERKGDEIMVCGQLYHTTTRVILWTDPGGYDAYRVEPRFAAAAPPASKAESDSQPPRRASRFGLRKKGLSPAEIEQVKGGGWDLPLLQRVVDQFVIHFDAAGTSRRCFEILQDRRGLSVQFMLDLDGTIYQTLDVKESAFHATIANGRSIGIEVANIGAYAENTADRLTKVYQSDQAGRVYIVAEAAPPPRAKPAIRESSGPLAMKSCVERSRARSSPSTTSRPSNTSRSQDWPRLYASSFPRSGLTIRATPRCLDPAQASRR